MYCIFIFLRISKKSEITCIFEKYTPSSTRMGKMFFKGALSIAVCIGVNAGELRADFEADLQKIVRWCGVDPETGDVKEILRKYKESYNNFKKDCLKEYEEFKEGNGQNLLTLDQALWGHFRTRLEEVQGSTLPFMFKKNPSIDVLTQTCKRKFVWRMCDCIHFYIRKFAEKLGSKELFATKDCSVNVRTATEILEPFGKEINCENDMEGTFFRRLPKFEYYLNGEVENKEIYVRRSIRDAIDEEFPYDGTFCSQCEDVMTKGKDFQNDEDKNKFLKMTEKRSDKDEEFRETVFKCAKDVNLMYLGTICKCYILMMEELEDLSGSMLKTVSKLHDVEKRNAYLKAFFYLHTLFYNVCGKYVSKLAKLNTRFNQYLMGEGASSWSWMDWKKKQRSRSVKGPSNRGKKNCRTKGKDLNAGFILEKEEKINDDNTVLELGKIKVDNDNIVIGLGDIKRSNSIDGSKKCIEKPSKILK